jgi:hypothetical protein
LTFAPMRILARIRIVRAALAVAALATVAVGAEAAAITWHVSRAGDALVIDATALLHADVVAARKPDVDFRVIGR